MESNLFKEAIADAKAVRMTSMANAKVALEEAFTEKYQKVFAERLKEDAMEGMNDGDSLETLDPLGDSTPNLNPDDTIGDEFDGKIGRAHV